MNLFENKWEIVSTIEENGAQGECFIVVSRQDNKEYFLKIINENKNSERLIRFAKEIVLFKLLDVCGIPKIIDTNANDINHINGEKLYFVTEYIIGDRLDKYINKNVLNEKDIIGLFIQLLSILKNCHLLEVVHRDIKPENIIISDGKLYLVDFGIAFYRDENSNLTGVSQEIGNRFLRLPEFSAGSVNKRDERSDVTLACGIYLYLLTKRYPRNLLDADGNMPHQRANVRDTISELENTNLTNYIFDKGFKYKISDRWNSADELLSVIEKMNDDTDSSKIDDFINLYSQNFDEQPLKEISCSLNNIHKFIITGLISSINQYSKILRFEKSDTLYNLGDLTRESQIRIYPIGKSNCLRIILKAHLIGEQIVGTICFNDEHVEILRTILGEPYDNNFELENKIALELKSRIPSILK